MFYMLISRTRPNLTAEDFTRLGQAAQGFYDNVPAGLKLHGDWAAQDGSRTFSVLETDDPALLEALRHPTAYLGALGSGRRHAARRERLAAS